MVAGLVRSPAYCGPLGERAVPGRSPGRVLVVGAAYGVGGARAFFGTVMGLRVSKR